MIKKIIKYISLTILILLLGIALKLAYGYWHPIQRLDPIKFGNITYPYLSYRTYLDFPLPKDLREDSREFNQATEGFMREQVEKYGWENVEADFTIDKRKDGTTVTFTGEGKKSDGTIEKINETMEFDIVIKGN